MRITALIVTAAAALALTACQNAEDKADASTEAVEAAGVADPAAANVTIDEAAADAQAAADAAAAAELAPAAADAPAPAPAAAAPAAPAAAH
jgi:ABC-type enterochelin transport system substrate-binding protein